ncbi:transcriptional regulator [Caldovatus sediminis]|uniref:Transcriptional regulator n=2 Tax=Caldovatus sediminis TaxID=2041189 RepID=A0A8J2ZDV5_9PROT|nr:transcriptional regulator [Caldovatus sediminis]
MDGLLVLRAFLATAHHGSFSAAARQAGVVPSVIAKRVDQLEWRLGRRLFHRSTRAVRLTEFGRAALSRIQRIVGEFDHLVETAAERRPALQGRIRVKAPTSLTILHLGEMLGGFQRAHPGIDLDVCVMDRPANPLEEGFDIAIGSAPVLHPGIVEVPLCPLRRVVCAAPDYLRRRGVPRHPRDLATHDCLNFSPTGTQWSFDGGKGPIIVDIQAKLNANDLQVLLAAARRGNGIAMLSRYVAASSLEAGELVPVLPEFPISEMWIKALVPEARLGVPRVRALLEWLQTALSPVPPWDRDSPERRAGVRANAEAGIGAERKPDRRSRKLRTEPAPRRVLAGASGRGGAAALTQAATACRPARLRRGRHPHPLDPDQGPSTDG